MLYVMLIYIHVCGIYMCCMYVIRVCMMCVVYMHVVCICMPCARQKKIVLGVFLYCSPPCSLDEGSLADPITHCFLL